MDTIRKLRLLRRIRRSRKKTEKNRVMEPLRQELTLSEKIRKYRLARRIGKRRRLKLRDEVELTVNQNLRERVRDGLRRYKIAKRIKKKSIRSNISKKEQQITLRQTNTLRRGDVSKRKRAYIHRQIRRRLVNIISFRYTFELDSHGVFNIKQGTNIILNGIAYFLIAYSIVFSLYSMAKGGAGWVNGISMRIFYYDTLPIFNPNLWTAQLVKMIYILGPTLSLFVMIFGILLLRYVMSEQGRTRILLVYLILISASFSIGEIGVSTIADGGLSHFYAWSWWSGGSMTLAFVLSFILLVVIGKTEQNAMLLTSTSFVGILPHRAFRAYFRYQYIIPTIIGILIVFLVKQPKMLTFELLELLSMITILLSSYVSLHANTNLIATDGNGFSKRYPFVPLILGVGSLLLIRVLGTDGISMITEFIYD